MLSTAADAAEPRARDDSVVLVEAGQMEVFQKRLKALNKKAVAFGLEPIKVIDSKTVLYCYRDEPVETGNGPALVRTLVPLRDKDVVADIVKVNRIEIEYPQIRLGEWQVVGKLEAMEGGNLAFTVTANPADAAAVSGRADHPIECEHCKTKRYRNDGFILRDSASGKYTQVGSNCLKDFTGIDPAAALFMARMYELVRTSGEDFDEYARSGRSNSMTVRGYLANVAFLTDHGGFVSSAKSQETGQTATYHTAAHMDNHLRDDRPLREAYIATRESYFAKADAIREWVAASPARSDFDRNVKLILQAEDIDLERKRLAFAAATVPMHNRYLAVEAEQRAPSQHVGQPGEKMASEVTIERVMTMPNPFGPGVNFLVLMRDQSGNRLKWKTASAPDDVANGEGRPLEASFKIKAHDLYSGTAQTSVTHLKVQRWLDHDPDAVRISIYHHRSGDPADFSQPVVAEGVFSRAELEQECRAYRWPQDGASSGGESVWFQSMPDEAGAMYSLHIHDIGGREPTAEDYTAIADMLDSLADHAHVAGADFEAGQSSLG